APDRRNLARERGGRRGAIALRLRDRARHAQARRRRALGEPMTEADWKGQSIALLKTKPALYALGGRAWIVALRRGATRYAPREVATPAPRVHVVHPTLRTLDTSLTLPGNIEAIEQASLYAHVGGYLKKIHVDEGDSVKKGQLLAEI